jgi:transcriptional regulator with XRE-family HTH domain
VSTSSESRYKELGKALLKACGKDQSQVAIARGVYVSPSAVNQWMNGKRRPLPGTLGLLAADLNLSPHLLAHLAGYDADPDALDKLLNAYKDRLRL